MLAAHTGVDPAIAVDTAEPTSRPLAAANCPTHQLNADWRVTSDDPPQWILERRSPSGWRHRSFCRTSAGLLQCVKEYCGPIDPGALTELRALPEYHP